MYMVRPSTSNAVMRAACASKAPKPAADTMADSTDISSAYRHGKQGTGIFAGFFGRPGVSPTGFVLRVSTFFQWGFHVDEIHKNI